MILATQDVRELNCVNVNLREYPDVIFVALVRPGNIERDGVGNREGLALSRDKSPGELCVGRIISVRVARG